MKVLVLANFGMGLYNFRKELLKELIDQENEVYISLPYDEYVPKLERIGCKFIETNLERRGKNPIADLKLLANYKKVIQTTKPNVVLTYTIKPNIYGGIACRITKTPYIANITGLGTSVETKGFIQKITLLLYRVGLKKASSVFFQNKKNRDFFSEEGIVKNNSILIPGSGVNLEHYTVEEYPGSDNGIKFLFIGRVMKAKGIEELLQAAKIVKEKYKNVQFDLIGGSEEDYDRQLAELNRSGIIKYHGQQDTVHSFIKKSHATILPSYHEGTANVLLETAASGRPVLASKVPGCKETFDENVSGIGFDVKSVESLVEAIVKFINLPHAQKKKMGLVGREKVEREFDRRIVINSYMDEIDKVIARRN